MKYLPLKSAIMHCTKVSQGLSGTELAPLRTHARVRELREELETLEIPALREKARQKNISLELIDAAYSKEALVGLIEPNLEGIVDEAGNEIGYDRTRAELRRLRLSQLQDLAQLMIDRRKIGFLHFVPLPVALVTLCVLVADALLSHVEVLSLDSPETWIEGGDDDHGKNIIDNWKLEIGLVVSTIVVLVFCVRPMFVIKWFTRAEFTPEERGTKTKALETAMAAHDKDAVIDLLQDQAGNDAASNGWRQRMTLERAWYHLKSWVVGDTRRQLLKCPPQIEAGQFFSATVEINGKRNIPLRIWGVKYKDYQYPKGEDLYVKVPKGVKPGDTFLADLPVKSGRPRSVGFLVTAVYCFFVACWVLTKKLDCCAGVNSQKRDTTAADYSFVDPAMRYAQSRTCFGPIAHVDSEGHATRGKWKGHKCVHDLQLAVPQIGMHANLVCTQVTRDQSCVANCELGYYPAVVLRRVAEAPTKNDYYTCTINSDLNPFVKLWTVMRSVGWDDDDRSDIAYWNHSGGPYSTDDDSTPVFGCVSPIPIYANNNTGPTIKNHAPDQYTIEDVDSQVWFEMQDLRDGVTYRVQIILEVENACKPNVKTCCLGDGELARQHADGECAKQHAGGECGCFMTDSVVCVYNSDDQWKKGGQALDDGGQSCNDDSTFTLGSQLEFMKTSDDSTKTQGKNIVVYSRRREGVGRFNISVQTGCPRWTEDMGGKDGHQKSKNIRIDLDDPGKGTQLWLPPDSNGNLFAYYFDDKSENNPCVCDPGTAGCNGLYTGDSCRIICTTHNKTAICLDGDECGDTRVTRTCSKNPDDPHGSSNMTSVERIAAMCKEQYPHLSIESLPEPEPEPEPPEPEPEPEPPEPEPEAASGSESSSGSWSSPELNVSNHGHRRLDFVTDPEGSTRSNGLASRETELLALSRAELAALLSRDMSREELVKSVLAQET